jgi:alkanesulfonate monooxygenase SsuD/methylene tetrahydromethanopterin reductase-like flavin-dependent oxidoreductase (luciferase family)
MHQMWAPSGEADSTFYQRTVEDIVLADQLGFDTVWIAEHHYVRSGPFYSRLPNAELLIASLIGQTKRIVLATGIKLLILDEPERVAEKLRLLNLLSGDRVAFGLGQGSPDEMGVRSMTSDEKRAAFRQSLAELAKFVSGGTVADGRTLTPEWPLEVANTLWAGVRDEVSIAQAAALGANFIVGEAELALRQAPYIKSYRAAGGVGEARGARLVCLAETHEDAVAAARDGTRHDVFSKGRYHIEMTELGMLPAVEAASDDDVFARLEYAVGTPPAVAELLASYIATTGVNALNIMVHAPGVSQVSAQRSMRLYMSEVAPVLLPILEENDPKT